MRQVPDRGNPGDAVTQQEGVLVAATRFEAAMADGNHGDAKSALDHLEADITSWLCDDYATGTNQYSKAGLLALIDDQRTRVDAIATDADSRFSTTELGVLGAAGVAGSGSLGYVLYRYGHYRESLTETAPRRSSTNTGP
jgi:hypothetical protein